MSDAYDSDGLYGKEDIFWIASHLYKLKILILYIRCLLIH